MARLTPYLVVVAAGAGAVPAQASDPVRVDLEPSVVDAVPEAEGRAQNHRPEEPPGREDE